MKKLFAIVLCAGIVVSMLAGCSSKPAASTPEVQNEPAEAVVSEAAAETVKETEAEVKADENWPLDVPRKLDKVLETSSDGKKIISIIYSIDQMDEGKEFEIGKMKKRVDDINAERDDIQVTFEVIDAAGDVSQQLADCETIAIKNPTVAIINPIDSSACATAFETLYNAGIYVIDTRGAETEYRDILHMGTNEDMIGSAIADLTMKYIDDNPDFFAKICLLDGGAAYPEQSKRVSYVRELAKANPDKMEILAEQFGDWSTETAMSVTEDWIQAYPDFNFLVSASDEMTIGCLSALRGANKDDVKIITVNGNASGLAMVDQGLALATIGSNQYIAKGSLIDAAVGLVDQTLDEKIYDVSKEATVVVTKENLKDFMDVQGFTQEDLVF